jgi:hypothetical protein
MKNMLYLNIYRKDTLRDAYITVTYTVENKLNQLLYRINFSDTKIHLITKYEVYDDKNISNEDIKPFQNKLKSYRLYKSIILNIPEINLSYFNRNTVFNLI